MPSCRCSLSFRCASLICGGVLLTVILIAVAAFFTLTRASSDADYWIKQAKLNAERQLDKFEPIIIGLSQGRKNVTADLVEQLKFLRHQIIDADDNNRILIPSIKGVVKQINDLVQGDPNFMEKGLFKILIAIVDGKRDNKSYYVLDGAQNWVQLRIPAMEAHPSDKVNKLKSQLVNVQSGAISARDTLDEMAQRFVKAIKRLHELSSDVGKNKVEIQTLATGLKDLIPEGEAYLKQSAALVDTIAKVVDVYDA
ncbi:hypothetical protein HDE_05980 [Halotydeus destructor]|nr:hypothetical protein HDE_05980 [Halotydeus destructor]